MAPTTHLWRELWPGLCRSRCDSGPHRQMWCWQLRPPSGPSAHFLWSPPCQAALRTYCKDPKQKGRSACVSLCGFNPTQSFREIKAHVFTLSTGGRPINTHVFQFTERGTGFAVAWQVSTTFVRPKYQLLSYPTIVTRGASVRTEKTKIGMNKNNHQNTLRGLTARRYLVEY